MLRRVFLLARLLGFAAILGVAMPHSGQASSSEGATRKTTQSESYVVFEPFYATILDNVRPRGLLLVELGLDVPDTKLREHVIHALPVLRDAYTRSLLVYSSTAVRPWRQPSVEDIAERLQAVTDQVMGQAGARVLLAQTAIRLTR